VTLTEVRRSDVATGPSRLDYDVIISIVQPGARVLDLGCGDGLLLARLINEKGARGTGVELSQEGVQAAIARGLSVVQGNLDEGLADYQDQSFDWVILNQTLQSLRKPALVLDEMLRVGKHSIVGLPNFAYWRLRLLFLLSGRVPSTHFQPYQWYDSPATRLLSIADFRAFCRQRGIGITQAVYLGGTGQSRRFWPNWRAETGIFVLAGRPSPAAGR
jgi:methionine biosynthesis protein MetW